MDFITISKLKCKFPERYRIQPLKVPGQYRNCLTPFYEGHSGFAHTGFRTFRNTRNFPLGVAKRQSPFL